MLLTVAWPKCSLSRSAPFKVTPRRLLCLAKRLICSSAPPHQLSALELRAPACLEGALGSCREAGGRRRAVGNGLRSLGCKMLQKPNAFTCSRSFGPGWTELNRFRTRVSVIIQVRSSNGLCVKKDTCVAYFIHTSSVHFQRRLSIFGWPVNTHPSWL